MAGVTSPNWRHFPLRCPSGGPHSWPLSAPTCICHIGEWLNGESRILVGGDPQLSSRLCCGAAVSMALAL